MSIDEYSKYDEEKFQKLMFNIEKYVIQQELAEEAIKNNGDWPLRDRLMLNKPDEGLSGG